MDLPKDELLKQAQETIKNFEDLGYNVIIHFKFTCSYCGERCIFQEANTLYEKGECCVCGKETIIKSGGYLLKFL